jgi:hypothetical protein
MYSLFTHSLRNPNAVLQAARVEQKIAKQTRKGNSSNVVDVACIFVHIGDRTTPSYIGTEAENDTITSTPSTTSRKKNGHVVPVITNRASARITLVRRRTGCPLKEKSNHIVLETPGACSGFTNDVEIS